VTDRYTGQRIALLTQHGKERVIAPVLEPALACRVERIDGYDTDQLGTFTRDTPRFGTQLEAARRKARIGMALSRLPVGLASEGSFAPDPVSGLFPWNVELLVLIDDRLGLEIVAVAQSAARSGQLLAADWDAVASFATTQDFPAHRLVLRPQSPDDPRIRKGIADWSELRQLFAQCRAEAENGQVFVETDLRAFANPTRMHCIRSSAEDLLRRLRSSCPACGLPGYWIAERKPGLPCAECRTPTLVHHTEVWACVACGHRAESVRADRQYADPGECPCCNP
jgi:hypothetical protein